MTLLRRDPVKIVAHELAELNTKKTEAIAQINEVVGNKRQKYITTSPGQESVYAKKMSEAKAYLADPTPVLATYRHLAAEVGVTAPTPYELAQLWVNIEDYWSEISAAIEGARMRAFAKIAAADDVAKVEAEVIAFRR